MDEPMAPNPPEGAVLDYYLKERASSPVQLEIFDSGGRLVRRFASNDELHKTNPNDVQFQVEWLRDPNLFWPRRNAPIRLGSSSRAAERRSQFLLGPAGTLAVRATTP